MIPTASTDNNNNNNNENLQMSQSQEIEANIQCTVLDNAVAEFLQDMNSWDHINDCTQEVVSNIIGERIYHNDDDNNNSSSSRFNIAGQDEPTPFRILRSQVQLGNDLGIDNSVSTFALDLVSPPTLLPGVSLIVAPNMCISSPQTYLMPSYLQANYGSLQMPQEILAPVVPSQASSSSVQSQCSDPSASWIVSSSPLLPTLDLPLLQQTPHLEYQNMPSQMHQYQNPTAQVSLSTSYPPSDSTTEISADVVVPVMNPLLEPQYFYNNDNPNLLDYLTTTTTASSGAVNPLPNEPVVVSPAPDIEHLFPPSLCSSYSQLSLSPSLPPASPWSPSLTPSSSCLRSQPTVTAVAEAAATATTTTTAAAATATTTTATATKTTKIAEVSCSASSKSIITTKNPTRPTPYPVRFYIMEPYQHSTTKVDRRSFNSCKELKQAKAKALESQDQIYRKC